MAFILNKESIDKIIEYLSQLYLYPKFLFLSLKIIELFFISSNVFTSILKGQDFIKTFLPKCMKEIIPSSKCVLMR